MKSFYKKFSYLVAIAAVIALLGAIRFAPPPARAAATYVQGKAMHSFSVTAASVTFASNVTAGNVIAVGASWFSTSVTLNSVSATCVTGNFTLPDNPITYGTTNRAAQGYAVVSTSGSCTVTATFSASVNAGIVTHEISGINTASPLDGHAMQHQSSPGTGVNAVSSGNITTTQSGDYIFGVAIDAGANSTIYTPGTGYTGRVTDSSWFQTEDKIQSAAGSAAATFTSNLGWDNPTTGIMAFKPADTTPPSIPITLSASAVSTSQINLSWTASTDNVGVTGYKVYRGGVQIGTTTSINYSDTSLAASTSYTYTVAAYDAAGNTSGQSASASATTQSIIAPPPPPPAGSVSYVQSANANSWGASALSAQFTTQNVTTGDLIAVVVEWSAGSATSLTSVTDSQGNAYTLVGSPVSGNGASAQAAHTKNVSGGSKITVTANFSNTSGNSEMLVVHEVKGADVLAPLDGYTSQYQGNPGTGANAVSSGNFTTSVGGDYIMGVVNDVSGNNSVFSSGTGYNKRESGARGSNTYISEDSVQSAAGQTSATFTTAAGTATLTLGLAFKPGTASASPPPPPPAPPSPTPPSPGAHVYTVKKDGTGNFTTIQACASAMAAGDTCTVYAGTYNEAVTIGAGAAGNYKTVNVNPGDTVNVFGFVLNSHAKVAGFTITNPSSPSSNSCVSIVGNSTDWFITNNTMTACGNGGSMITEPLYVANTSFGYIQGNTLSYGCSTSSAPNVCEGMLINGDHHLIENNNISHVSDGVTKYGSYNVYRGNTMHDANATDCGSQSSNCHIDFIESEPVTGSGVTRPAQFNLYEGNTLRNNLGPNGHAFLTQGDACGGQCFHAIIRFNDLAHVGSYDLLDQLGGFYYVKSYNNDIVDFRVPNFDVTDYFGQSSTNGSETNNIFYWPNSITIAPYAVDSTSVAGFRSGSNLAYCTGTCSFTDLMATDPGNKNNVNPLFTNYAGDNFHLQTGSPAIGAGTNLTMVASGDIGSGTSLVVNDAGFFQDGYGLAGVQPDWIAVGSAGNVAQIASINYATNVITLATPLTRTTGAPVYLYKNSSGNQVLYGTAPDIGAYPFTGSVVTPPETTPPSVPTGLSATALSSSQINLVWTASTDNVGVTGYKIYRGGTQVGTSATNSYADTGLAASTSYTYTVAAYDAAGNNSAQSASVSATTQAAPDTTPPAVSLITPINGATVSGSATTVSASASDNVGVAGVQFKLDGANLGPEVTVAPYSISWNTTLSANGSHTLTAVARDAAGNTATSPAIMVTVSNSTNKFAIGDRVQTTASLNVRSTPSTSGTLVGTQVQGALGTVAAGPISAGGYTWWNITYDNAPSGWSVENYLVKYGEPSSALPLCLELGSAIGTPSKTIYVYFDANAAMYSTTTKPVFCQ